MNHPYLTSVLNSMFTKMSGAWEMVGNIVNTAGVATLAISGTSGILAGYRTYASPHTSLSEAGRRLKRVKSRLQGLSPKRRKEIEIASRSESSNCLGLDYLEEELEECVLLIVSFSISSSRWESLGSRMCT